ncbi:MAG: glutamate--cysteine ligase [Mariprofundales bacterium]|nr:glutamate--cysteine ligase [Mariprofundales bacterium]
MRQQPPTIDSRDMLIRVLSCGCKPSSQWRIGTEHEKISFNRQSLRPIPYFGKRGIAALLLQIAENSQWQPILEGENIIGLTLNRASITLEPGGQFELSGAPLETIFATCKEVHDHLALLDTITKELDIGFLGIGFQPKWGRKDIHWMPKERYRIMRNYMPKVGSLGLDMMLRTATVQANLDFSDEADMARKMRIACALQPLVTALFAASPFRDGRPSGFLSTRAACWLDTDSDRTGIPRAIFDDNFSFASYVEWALSVPMYFIHRDGEYIDCSGASFELFMEGRLPQLPNERATIADWELHLSTLFPEVRLKQFLEVRGADSGDSSWICALPALWKGLLYDPQAQERAWQMVADWSWQEVNQLRHTTPRHALATKFRDTTALQLCQQMVTIANDGLRHLDTGGDSRSERLFLTPLFKALDAGLTQADIMLQHYHGKWQQQIDPLFTDCIHI